MDHTRLPLAGRHVSGDGLDDKGSREDYTDQGFVYPKGGAVCSCLVSLLLHSCPSSSPPAYSALNLGSPHTRPTQNHLLNSLVWFTKAYPSVAFQVPAMSLTWWTISLFLSLHPPTPNHEPPCLILLGKKALTPESQLV